MSNIKHKAAYEPWYSNWQAMVRRMTNPKDPAYQTYVVEKGLEIDEIFITDPWAFYEEIGEYPGKGYSIDRIDNKKGYVKGNIRWANAQTQAANKGLYQKNKSGISGITWNTEKRKWEVRIYRNKRTFFVGRFRELSEAKKAYLERVATV